MSCTLTPLGSRVILKRDRLKSEHIIITDTASKRNAPMKGTIVAFGAACEWPLVVGKEYLHGRHAGDWVNADGSPTVPEDGEFYIIDEADLLAEVNNV